MSKHRRPSRLAALRQVGSHSTLHISLAAGVAGTVAVSGTMVAAAAETTTTLAGDKQPADSGKHRKTGPTAETPTPDQLDPASATGALALRDAVADAQRERAERLAAAKARAEAKRRALAAAKRQAAQRQAAQARTFQSASRSVERMSASAANVLQIAAQVAYGASYSYGGDGPNAFDCSGFTSYVFDKVGISLPHSSAAQAQMVQRVSSPQPGDLVFVYNGGGGTIGHVGIYAGDGYWWEASNPSMGVGKHKAWSSNVSYGRIL